MNTIPIEELDDEGRAREIAKRISDLGDGFKTWELVLACLMVIGAAERIRMDTRGVKSIARDHTKLIKWYAENPVMGPPR